MGEPRYGNERPDFLPDELLELLELLSRHVATHRPDSDPSRWMFEATAGQPPHQNTVGHPWRQACSRAGVTGVTLHDLRHLYASALIAAGRLLTGVRRFLRTVWRTGEMSEASELQVCVALHV